MSIEKIVFLYEDGEYRSSFIETLKSLKYGANHQNIIYLIKNIITRDEFTITNKEQMKLLILYYFYLFGEVAFTNGYKILFHREKCIFNLSSLPQLPMGKLDNFKQFFDLGKNEVFLNKIIDTTSADAHLYNHPDNIKVSNLTDFFIVFLHENFELYSLEGEHFPLFKWLINEVQEDGSH